MPELDHTSLDIVCKVVFAGPAEAGVGTSFRELWALIPDAADTAVFPGPGDPPIYELRYRPRPSVRRQGWSISHKLVGYEGMAQGATFAEVLSGADAIVLVMDSAPAAMDANDHAIRSIESTMANLGSKLSALTCMLQYNKRDLPDAVAIREMEKRLNPKRWPYVATSAHRGQGLQDLLDRINQTVSKGIAIPEAEEQRQPMKPPRRPSLASRKSAEDLSEKTPKKELAPTAGQANAFSRAQDGIFGRGHARPSLAADIDEDRTAVATPGAPPPAQPAARTSLIPGMADDVGEDDETILGKPGSSSAPYAASSPIIGAEPAPPSGPASIAPNRAAAAQPAMEAPAATSGQEVGLTSAEMAAPWDDSTDGNVKVVPVAASEAVDVTVPELKGSLVTRIDEPYLLSPKVVKLPLQLRTDGKERSVDLKIDFSKGGAAASSGTSAKGGVPVALFVVVALVAVASTVGLLFSVIF